MQKSKKENPFEVFELDNGNLRTAFGGTTNINCGGSSGGSTGSGTTEIDGGGGEEPTPSGGWTTNYHCEFL